MNEPVAKQLRAATRRADQLRDRAHQMLIDSARSGAAAGLTQRDIANAMGRSQPEVSRLIRFHGSTRLAQSLMRNRAAVLDRLRRSNAVNPRVFGSVSRGDDGPTSDIDLLVDFRTSPSLFELGALEAELSALVGASVDVVASNSLRKNIASRALSEAVPL